MDDSQPIYLQVAGQIEEQILSGDLSEGERVMSTNEWASFLRINPATAAKGINLLVDDGLLEKRRGIGMFVRDGATEQLLQRRREAFFADRVDSLVTEAALLDIPVDELVQRLTAAARARADQSASNGRHPPGNDDTPDTIHRDNHARTDR